jgi:hypothetical protein
MRPSAAELLILGVAVLWVVNFGLRLAGQRLYWFTFWTLAAALPALAIYWFSTPRHVKPGANFGAGIPEEFYLGVIALALWVVVLVLELVVFIVLRIRDSRRAAQSGTGVGESHRL